MTAEQLEASRSERMRQNGRGQLTLEDARTWLEETGLCLFLPRRQFSTFIAPSFVEAVAGERNSAPAGKIVTLAEELLIRLEADGVAVRLNLLGQPGEQPDYVVAGWVLPYVYALRGDRDWRRSPQLTGSRQVSPLAIQAYKLLEAGDATIPQLKHALGREVSESAVLRAITELWQQLRIIPVVSAPGKPAQWQPLRLRFQKAIAEGASTSQVTAISVLASIYLQAVIAASMEEVEMFLAPLTARSKVREVLRGLVATRQVHTISLGHAPHFYVAGTLPEFSAPPTAYASSAMPAAGNFLRAYDYADGAREAAVRTSFISSSSRPAGAGTPAESTAPRNGSESSIKAQSDPQVARLLSRPPARSRSRKPNQVASGSHASRRNGRSAASRGNGASRRGATARWTLGTSNGARGKHHPAHTERSSLGVARQHRNGNPHTNGSAAMRKSKPAAARSLRSGYAGGVKASAKPASRRPVTSRPGTSRNDARTDKRAVHGNRNPAMTATAKAGNRARYGFTAPSRQRSKKRG